MTSVGYPDQFQVEAADPSENSAPENALKGSGKDFSTVAEDAFFSIKKPARYLTISFILDGDISGFTVTVVKDGADEIVFVVSQSIHHIEADSQPYCPTSKHRCRTNLQLLKVHITKR